jgi:hypothetical protein
MTLPILPEITFDSSTLPNAKEQLLELRQSLHQVCKDVDERLQRLESHENEQSQAPAWQEQVPSALKAMPVNAEQTEAERAYAPMETRLVMEATSPSAMSQDLEQATLEELNSALAKAFAQMAGRMVWQ